MHKVVCSICVLIVCHLMFVTGEAQTRPSESSAGTGSISGRITNGDKPLADVGLALQPIQTAANSTSRRPTLRGQTDAEGRYQFLGVPAGNYQLMTFSPLYVLAGDPRTSYGKQIGLNEGETMVDVNFALVRGGAVTGKITDTDGRPLIEQYVQFDRLDAQNNVVPISSSPNGTVMTDDRGVYRMFGLPPGQYRVSAGEGEGAMMRTSYRRSYPRTFHPDAQDPARATVIDVREGNELTGIDIKLGLQPKSFVVSGRAVDAETGEPVANLMVTCNSMASDGRLSTFITRIFTTAAGEFRIEKAVNGRYGLIANGDGGAGIGPTGYSDLVPFEVQDGDISGIEIRVKRGASITGVVVLEGTSDPEIRSRFAKIRIFALGRDDSLGPSSQNGQFLKQGPDGRFRLDGLRPGLVSMAPMPEPVARGITLAKIERDGVTQPNGVEVGPGDQITGIRVVFAHGNGVIRGQVVMTGGTLPEGLFFFVTPRRVESPRSELNIPVRTDGRGYFVLEGLAPGQYELEARAGNTAAPPPEGRRPPLTVRQTVEVANGQTAEVKITFDLNREKPDRER